MNGAKLFERQKQMGWKSPGFHQPPKITREMCVSNIRSIFLLSLPSSVSVLTHFKVCLLLSGCIYYYTVSLDSRKGVVGLKSVVSVRYTVPSRNTSSQQSEGKGSLWGSKLCHFLVVAHGELAPCRGVPVLQFCPGHVALLFSPSLVVGKGEGEGEQNKK